MKETKVLKPGERLVSIIFLLFSIWVFKESLAMFRKDPSAASYGALPLGMSIVMILCMLKIILLEDLKKHVECKGITFKEKFVGTFSYLLSKDVLVFLALIIVYTVLLFIGAGFLISSAVFMLSCMFYFMPRDKKTIKTNIIFTVILLAFLYLAFKVAFRIVLP